MVNLTVIIKLKFESYLVDNVNLVTAICLCEGIYVIHAKPCFSIC